MTQTPKLHVVLGAAGAAGSALVRELARQGRPVRAVTRDHDRPVSLAPGVTWASADATRAETLRAAIQGASTVYMAMQPPYTRWPEEFPGLLENVLSAVRGSGARLVMVDNLYMYGPVDGPIHERLPYAATDRKGRTRALLAERLLRAHREGEVEVALGRAADYYGPGVRASVTSLAFFQGIAAGKRPRWPVTLDQPHSLTFTPDFARALVLLGERPEAPGRAWHVPASEPLTGRAFIELVAREAGTTVRPGVLPRALVRAAGLFDPMAREFAEMFYEFERPYVIDGSDFARTFDFAPTPHPDAIRRTLDSLRAQDATSSRLQPAR